MIKQAKIEPTVKIVTYTQDALELLIYTKSGRLNTGTTLEEILTWDEEKKLEHLAYMMDTIKSSFEFADYTFEIKNVSRAFTHQVVRTRTASFQQQAMRVVDARDFTYLESSDNPRYKKIIEFALEEYGAMIDEGEAVQDARGVLPIAIHTEIFVKANLRTLSQMAELRLCKRAEGEYQNVFRMMVAEVLKIHPWAEPLLQCYCVKTALCYFPRYTNCPVQKFCIDPSIYTAYRAEIKTAWENNNHVANPVANENGMTM